MTNIFIKPNHSSLHFLALRLCAGAVLISLGSMATAHKPPENGQKAISIADMEERAEARFIKIDINGDNEIDAAEFSSAKYPDRQQRRKHGGKRMHRRHHLATNCGHPDKAMDRPYSEEKRSRFEGHKKEMADKVFDALDTDGTGELSRAEATPENVHSARRHLMRQHLFERMDADGNGTLNRSEMSKRLTYLRQMDSNADGRVDPDELCAGRKNIHEKMREQHKST